MTDHVCGAGDICGAGYIENDHICGSGDVFRTVKWKLTMYVELVI